MECDLTLKELQYLEKLVERDIADSKKCNKCEFLHGDESCIWGVMCRSGQLDCFSKKGNN